MLAFVVFNSSPPHMFLWERVHSPQLICLLFLSLTHFIFAYSFTHSCPLYLFSLLPFAVRSLNVSPPDLCFSYLFSIFFTLPLLPTLPLFFCSLPAMQTLKVNLHSKVLLPASGTVTERFSSVPPLFCLLFFCPFFNCLLIRLVFVISWSCVYVCWWGT